MCVCVCISTLHHDPDVCLAHIMQDSKEIEGSSGAGGGAGVEAKEGVVAEGGVVGVAIGEGAVVLPAGRVLPE